MPLTLAPKNGSTTMRMGRMGITIKYSDNYPA
jgi:hypothetical protein